MDPWADPDFIRDEREIPDDVHEMAEVEPRYCQCGRESVTQLCAVCEAHEPPVFAQRVLEEYGLIRDD